MLLASLAPHAVSENITVSFELIPFALGANDMSPDGRYVVGEADWNSDGLSDGSYLWDSVTNTYTDLENIVDPTTGVPVVAVSDDGSVVLGNMADPNDPNAHGSVGNVAAIWRASTGEWESLGYLPNAGLCPSRSSAYELSADGTVACGLSWDGCSGRAFRWTQATGMVEMQNQANGGNRASVISADGTLLAGFAQGSFERTPTIWDAAGNGDLLDPPNGDALGEIHGMNDAGTIMLGTWADPNDPVALAHMWTPGTGPGGWDRAQIAAGAQLPGWTGVPEDVSDCGTIVGFDFLVGNRRAWIQLDGQGNLLYLKDWITAHGGTVTGNIPLEVCQAITTDGRTIIGHGFGTGAWRVTITRTPDCPGDASGDSTINISDVGIVLSQFGQTGCGLDGDVTGDGVVNISDLGVVLANFGTTCP
jgi:hypothetical protein